MAIFDRIKLKEVDPQKRCPQCNDVLVYQKITKFTQNYIMLRTYCSNKECDYEKETNLSPEEAKL